MLRRLILAIILLQQPGCDFGSDHGADQQAFEEFYSSKLPYLKSRFHDKGFRYRDIGKKSETVGWCSRDKYFFETNGLISAGNSAYRFKVKKRGNEWVLVDQNEFDKHRAFGFFVLNLTGCIWPGILFEEFGNYPQIKILDFQSKKSFRDGIESRTLIFEFLDDGNPAIVEIVFSDNTGSVLQGSIRWRNFPEVSRAYEFTYNESGSPIGYLETTYDGTSQTIQRHVEFIEFFDLHTIPLEKTLLQTYGLPEPKPASSLLSSYRLTFAILGIVGLSWVIYVGLKRPGRTAAI